MRIGINPELRRNAGGIYQYSVTVLRALHEWSTDDRKDQFLVLADDIRSPEVRNLQDAGWVVSPSHPPSIKASAKALLSRFGLSDAAAAVAVGLRSASKSFDIDTVKTRPQDRRWLENLGIELVVYPSPQTRSFEIGLPYVMAIHDLQHRFQPEFPEVSANGEWELREYVFRNGARNAVLVLADSEVGREDILNCYEKYGVKPERVKALPFLPASYLPSSVSPEDRLRVRQKYSLPERFLFYPAQFWPHKNHGRIVSAVALLQRNLKMDTPFVFCGSNDGAIRQNTYGEMTQLALKNHVEHLITKLGYVPDEDMGALYSASVALVMPTFFGPTNIPVLEAWRFGCPVITSDIRGIREQVGDAAILVDPKSPEAIADAIRKVWCDSELRDSLASRGHNRLGSYTPLEFRRRLIDIIEEAKEYAAN